MTDIWTDQGDLDYVDSDEGEDLYDGGEGFDDESRSGDRRRRARAARARAARAQQIAAARYRARERTGNVTSSTTAPRPTAQKAVAAIKNLDLETKVQEDAFRRTISAQDKRVTGAEVAALVAALTPTTIRVFGIDNTLAQTALTAAPLAFLRPKSHGTGIEAVVKDVRVLGLVGAATLLVVEHQRGKSSTAQRIDVLGPSQLVEGEEDVFLADVLDGRGKPAKTAVTWSSDNPGVATIDPASGRVRAGIPGVAVISAKADDVVTRRRLSVLFKPQARSAPNASTPSGAIA